MDVRHAIFSASRDGKIRKLQRMLEDTSCEILKAAVSSKTNGATPLVIASKNGHLETVEFLIREMKADVEQVGNVQFDGETIEGAPPLWCAAAAGHFDVVKCLIKHQARVNSTTKTKSTPLRAACYDGHLEIVKYLVDCGADVEIANRHGHTCLMIACYKGHYNIARYLIECGANVNRKSVKGNTALHDCAESGSLDIMQLLLDNNAKMDIDYYGVTPLIAAALTGHSPIVELIINSPICCSQERVDALELLGATCVDKKRDMLLALEYWRRALRERKLLGLEIKRRTTPVAAYSDAVEVTTEQELSELFSDPDDMRMQALLVRERILGPAHPDTSYYIRYRGAVYADTGNYDKCIKLWMYALNMQQAVLDTLNPMIQSSLLSFAELFSFMMAKVQSMAKVKFCDLFAVFERSLTQLQLSIAASNGSESDFTCFHRTLVVVLHFVGLLCRVQPYLDHHEVFLFKKAVYKLVRSKPRAKNGMTPLHLACLRDSSCPSLRFPLCEFPMPEMVKLLLEVGASVNDIDRDRNTALHLAAVSQQVSHDVVSLLLENGAHLDARNSRGETPLQLLSALVPSAFSSCVPVMRFLSLQCLAAQAITRHQIPVRGILTKELENFVRLH